MGNKVTSIYLTHTYQSNQDYIVLQEFLSYPSFIKNKYYYCYLRLAQKIISENRTHDSSIHENHHVLPNSFLQSVSTLSYSFKEHYIAHLLLTKFTTSKDKRKMTFALHTFFHFDRNRKLKINHNSIAYIRHKILYREACKARPAGNDSSTSDKKLYKFKNVATEEIFEGTRIDLLNYTDDLTPHDINALIRAYKVNQHCKLKGWAIYNDFVNEFSDDIERKYNGNDYRKLCKHCHREINLGNYARWHGDNCKLKSS